MQPMNRFTFGHNFQPYSQRNDPPTTLAPIPKPKVVPKYNKPTLSILGKLSFNRMNVTTRVLRSLIENPYKLFNKFKVRFHFFTQHTIVKNYTKRKTQREVNLTLLLIS